MAVALRHNEIQFETIDFSRNERSLYENGLVFLLKYRNKFEAEGNISLFESKMREYTTGKSLYEQGLARRYLYIVSPKGDGV